MRDSKPVRYGIAACMSVSLMWSGIALAADALTDARSAFDQRKYEEALRILSAHLDKAGGDVNALELRVRTYLKLGQADKAVSDYLRWSTQQGRDDHSLLRELCLKVIAGAMGDMREQMRGAAVTALKEMGGAETVPVFEVALADQSGLVRALAVEGLARDRRRRSCRAESAGLCERHHTIVKRSRPAGQGSGRNQSRET